MNGAGRRPEQKYDSKHANQQARRHDVVRVMPRCARQYIRCVRNSHAPGINAFVWYGGVLTSRCFGCSRRIFRMPNGEWLTLVFH